LALTVALLGLGAVMAAGDVIGAHAIVGRGRSLIAWYCASLTVAVAAWQADHHTPTSVRRSIAKGSGHQPAHVFLTARQAG